jgi:hypothetical protein
MPATSFAFIPIVMASAVQRGNRTWRTRWQGPQEPIDIPEDEWSRAPTPERSRASTPFEPSRAVWPRRVILATLILLALLLARYGLG